jgi:hypothetical protein
MIIVKVYDAAMQYLGEFDEIFPPGTTHIAGFYDVKVDAYLFAEISTPEGEA